MTLPVVAAVHGIATDYVAREAYAFAWEIALFASGFEACVLPVTWSSTGSPVRDLAGLLASKRFREDAVNTVAAGIRVTRATATLKGAPFAILAHSAGGPIVVEALRRLGASLPVVGIGTPLGHPLWGPALAAVGLGAQGPMPAGHAIDLWNNEDSVCSLGSWHREPSGWRSIRVAFAGRESFVREHLGDLYCAAPAVSAALREVVRES